MGKGTIGLKNLHTAVMLTDERPTATAPGSATYDTPEYLAGAMNCNVNRQSNSTTVYTDDGPTDILTSAGEIEIELTTDELPLEQQSKLLGHEIRNGVLIRRSTDKAPYVALGFQSENADGSYKFVWVYKGKFQVPSQEHATKGETPEIQPRTLTGRFARRDADEITDIETNDDAKDLPAGTIANWFKKVISLEDLVATP